ncbi:hypothetical protein BDV26DRAFT_161813 [Aspergillus bertholletiae]|uniref:Uncharacterized protein n=1 Tax=Aspergillus bertholletiae TaxID=1226010 RepID=A0A5N7BN60_9EURO|nr:hypothetical protein BDV26DRAFT_161813 [Aspergillus bertholletiae]
MHPTNPRPTLGQPTHTHTHTLHDRKRNWKDIIAVRADRHCTCHRHVPWFPVGTARFTGTGPILGMPRWSFPLPHLPSGSIEMEMTYRRCWKAYKKERRLDTVS